jgi:hypothetical protein
LTNFSVSPFLHQREKGGEEEERWEEREREKRLWKGEIET